MHFSEKKDRCSRFIGARRHLVRFFPSVGCYSRTSYIKLNTVVKDGYTANEQYLQHLIGAGANAVFIFGVTRIVYVLVLRQGRPTKAAIDGVDGHCLAQRGMRNNGNNFRSPKNAAEESGRFRQRTKTQEKPRDGDEAERFLRGEDLKHSAPEKKKKALKQNSGNSAIS